MADEKRQSANWLRGGIWILGTLVAGLCLTLAGCAGTATPASGPTPTKQPVPTLAESPSHDTPALEATPTPGAMQVAPQPTPTPFVPFGGSHDTLSMPHPEFYGAAAAPLEKRIYVSDVIVRAKLVSVEAPDQQDLLRRIVEATNDAEQERLVSQFPLPTILTFKALEYVKGSGPDEFTVGIKDANNDRDDTWDDQEALLFLNTAAEAGAREPDGSDGAAAQRADPPLETYAFASSYGLKDEVYTIESVNPVWLPAAGQPQAQADGASNSSDPQAATSFPTEWDHDTGKPTDFMTLAEIKKTLAWVKGDGTREYERCVGAALNHLVWNRDWEAFYGTPKEPGHHWEEIASGKGAGIAIYEGGELYASQYHRFWLTGEDAERFQAINVDDDNDPSTGYHKATITARPLPAGQYSFSDHGVLPWYVPCGYNAEGRLDWTVTVEALVGALHEAFFDPVAIGQGVGANATNGALEPAAITAGGYATTIKSLVWQDKKVTLTLSPYVSLLGQTLDFIAQDGTIGLSLEAKSATADASAGTYAWTQATRPWSAGDQLMLRLHGPTVSIADASGPEGKEVEFQVALSEAVDHEVRVSWKAEFHDTAKNYAVPNEYWHMSGELVFQPGETSRSAEVFLNDDTWREDDEVFLVILSDPKGATIADGEGVMTIIDDD